MADLLFGQVTQPDEVDGIEERKVAELKSQLWMATQLMEKFKSDIDQLQKIVEEQGQENRLIKTKFADLEKDLQRNGLREQQQVKEYLEDYVTKKKNPNRAAIEHPDGSSVDTRPGLKRYSTGDPSELTEAISRFLAVDVVRYMVESGNQRGRGQASPKAPQNRYAVVMRKCVSEAIDRNSDVFYGLLRRLDINGFETLTQVADFLFAEGTNWGRIVSLYAYGGFIAREVETADKAFATMIGDFLGFYVTTRLSTWIDEQGGWVRSNSVALVFCREL